jgi:hypothetical protein
MHSQRAFANFASFREYAAIRSGKTGDAATQESGIMILRRNARQACSSAQSFARLVCNGEGSPHAESRRQAAGGTHA